MSKFPVMLATCFVLAGAVDFTHAETLATKKLPPEFEAIYEVRKGEIIVGEMRLSLRKQDGRLVYESRTYPVGIAAFFLGSKVATYRTVLEKTEDRYRAVEFEYEVHGAKKDRNEQYVFDWSSHTVHTRYKGETGTLSIAPHTLDRFSVQLLLMREPDAGIMRYTCPVVSRGRLKEYVYELEPHQPVQTRLGSFSAHKYVREKNDRKGTRYTEWYAESLHYIPVRSDKTRNGKTEISARIMEVRWL